MECLTTRDRSTDPPGPKKTAEAVDLTGHFKVPPRKTRGTPAWTWKHQVKICLSQSLLSSFRRTTPKIFFFFFFGSWKHFAHLSKGKDIKVSIKNIPGPVLCALNPTARWKLGSKPGTGRGTVSGWRHGHPLYGDRPWTRWRAWDNHTHSFLRWTWWTDWSSHG